LAPLLTFVAFNTGDDILGAATVRQALSHAVNRTQILQTAFGGFGTLAAGILPPAHWAANPDLPIPGYDPALAAAMLNAAGLTDGDGDGWRDLPGGGPWQPAIRVEAGNRTEEAAALLVAGDYRRIGVQAQAEPVPFETLIDDLLTHDYQAAVYSLPVPATLDRRARWHSDQIEAEFGLNLAAYANPQVDGWLDAANTVRHCAPEARAALYRQIQAQLVEDRPVDFLVAPTYFVVVKESLAGVAPGPFAPLTWNAASWDLLE
ncbi:MAG: ABC transporter substrate-binding protein, partial [Anaerolineae bacterium]